MRHDPRVTITVQRGGSGTYAYVYDSERLLDVWAMHIEPMPEEWPEEWKQAVNDARVAVGLPPVDWATGDAE